MPKGSLEVKLPTDEAAEVGRDREWKGRKKLKKGKKTSGEKKWKQINVRQKGRKLSKKKTKCCILFQWFVAPKTAT